MEKKHEKQLYLMFIKKENHITKMIKTAVERHVENLRNLNNNEKLGF